MFFQSGLYNGLPCTVLRKNQNLVTISLDGYIKLVPLHLVNFGAKTRKIIYFLNRSSKNVSVGDIIVSNDDETIEGSIQSTKGRPLIVVNVGTHGEITYVPLTTKVKNGNHVFIRDKMNFDSFALCEQINTKIFRNYKVVNHLTDIDIKRVMDGIAHHIW